MRSVLADLVQRKGTGYLPELVIVLARARFAALDGLARATGTDAHHWFESREALVVEGRVTTIRGRHLAVLEPTRVMPLSETLLYQSTD